MDPWVLELIGYIASVLVAISLMMSSLLRLRLINLLGSITFTVYGVLIAAYPVAAVNLFIVFVNLFYLRTMLRRREYFRLLEVEEDSEYLRYFLDFHREQIRRFAPGLRESDGTGRLRLFVLRDLIPAGLLIGEQREGRLHVELDYVLPQYRDFKVGRYLFEDRAGFFRERGVREIVSPGGPGEHETYLRRVGFRDVGDGTFRRSVG